MKRRAFLSSAAFLLASAGLPQVAQSNDEPSLLDLAREMQKRAYVPNTAPLAPPFADLTYDAFRGIRPKPGHSAMIPHGPRFAFDLLPPGLYFPDPVAFDRATADGISAFEFSPALFSYEPRYFDTIPDHSPGAGFSGFRLRYPLNAPDRMDEVMVVQGASYFRAIGQAMVYGLSARAVALGTGGSGPEEFPRFTHLRLHRARGESVRLEAALDSPSLSGHIALTLWPGRETKMDIVATILPRREIADIGVAPLTSMYLKGPMLAAVSDDFRPRVHDTDVLVVQNGAGEVLWRPLANPGLVESSAFVDRSPKRFGLYQTPRAFGDFQDTEARYHDRPSAFVEPLEDWGEGAVTLVELPTGEEFLDNIVAFWRPDEPLQAGQEYRYRYRLTWTQDAPDLNGLPRIRQSRSGREHDRPGHRRFVLDFAAKPDQPTPLISASDGAEIIGVGAFGLPDGNGTRVTFLFEPGPLDAAELRVSLTDHTGAPQSPVWLHRWTRARDGGV